MNRNFAGICLAGMLLQGTFAAGPSRAQEPSCELNVHLVQANNDSPYCFVRAKFEPGEVMDPWAVRIFDQQGNEAPYFVWDSVTWRVACQGREDWGHRYALLNHHPGDAPEARDMRPRRLEAAKQQLPELGAMLAAQDEASKRYGDSICAALYLVRHTVPAFGKDKLTLRVYPTRQTEPNQRTLDANRVGEGQLAAAGELALHNLPGAPIVKWKGQEIFRYAGFSIGDKSSGKDGFFGADSYADPAGPMTIEVTEGIITKLALRGQSNGRAGDASNWQCTYWLFPEGSYVALTGFSLDNSEGFLGGGLTMAVCETRGRPKEVHQPEWERPWWLFQVGNSEFAAICQYTDTPLAVGYGNTPFNVSTPDSFGVIHGEKTKGQGDGGIELHWNYELTDRRIYRLFHPRLDNDGTYDLAEVTDLRQSLLMGGKLTNVPTGLVGKDGRLVWPPARVSAMEEALAHVKWRPREDWLHRQYLVGVGDNAAVAETSIRRVLGAAVGWIDRPFGEDELTELIVQFSLRKSSRLAATGQQNAWMVLPALLDTAFRTSVREALARCSDPVVDALNAMEMIRNHVAAGGNAIEGMTKGGGEGWHNNPAYFAVSVPESLRFMDHFGLFELAARPKSDCREALLRWADFSLETLGGKPLDWDQLRTSMRSLWPNRVVMLVPLMLQAYHHTGDETYTRAARLVFDDLLMSQVETNPHGYFWAWGQSARKAELFDTNYNVAACDRGLIDFWSEGLLHVIDRDRAARFVAAQARYLVASGQFLDTLETDSMTAVQSQVPGGIPWAIGQISLLMYDDFPFYRGLVGDMIRWSVIDDGEPWERREGRRNLYTLKMGSRGLVFWAYGLGRNTPSSSETARKMVARWNAETESQ